MKQPTVDRSVSNPLIAAYLEAGGTLENTQLMAADESPRTTKLYERTGDDITLDEVERISILECPQFRPTGDEVVSADRRLALAFGITLLTNPAVSIAQTCESLPADQALPSNLSYQFRANVPRCEGMYRNLVLGSPRVTLVSLTFGKVTYDTKRDRYLEIKLPAEPAETTLIRALGVPERLYYRLDVKLGRGKSVFRLPLADVVAPKNILPDEFGIYAVKKLPGNQNAFVPVYAHGSGAAAQGDIVAVVRPGADVTDVQWRSYAPNVPPTAWAPVAGASGLVPEGTRLEIMLSKDMPPQMTLEVSFLSNGIGRADRFVLDPKP